MGIKNLVDSETILVIDDVGMVPFLRRININPITGAVSVFDVELDGITTYVPVGNVITPNQAPLTTVTLAGASEVSQPSVVGDYKTISDQQDLLWSKVGTGTYNWATGEHTLSVTAGQYYIMQSYRFHEYISGNPQSTEFTTRRFDPETNVIKLAGPYHSAFVAPYNTSYDGIMIRSQDSDIQLDVYRLGTQIDTIPFSSWDNQRAIDWAGFNVFVIEYLWLGGVGFKLHQMYGDIKVLRHTYRYAGFGRTSTMIGIPNQPIRYEIRSTGGSGTFVPICARVSTNGSIGNVGMPGGETMATACNANTPGTTYMVMAIRLKTAYLKEAIREISAGIKTSGANDVFNWRVYLNPTIANQPGWTSVHANSPIEWQQGDTAQTLTGGYPLTASIESTRASTISGKDLDPQRIIGVSNDGVSDVIAVGITPVTSNIDAYASFNWLWR